MSIVQSNRPWWKNATVYQIYPASFQDSNGDGFGDLRGILSRLDYLRDLGVDAIWVCPFYDSPQDDLGYDVRNYEDVYRPYGTVADVEALIEGCHEQGMRFITDLVINHTSDQHEWFKESRSSKDNPKRTWYHWHPGRIIDGKRVPPNNWRSSFKGSAWQWDELTQEYYLHLFGKSMPDLNHENSDLRQAVYNSAIRFWLEKGVDGFRIDTMTIYGKSPGYPDAPVVDESQPWQPGGPCYRNKDRTYQVHREIHDQLLSNYGGAQKLITVGEFGSISDLDLALKYVSAKECRIGMGLQFETVLLGFDMCQFDLSPFTLADFKRTHAKWQQFIEGTDGWTSVFLENHDIPRSITRFGSDAPEFRERSAKMLATFCATSTSTLFIYQGQEIAMTNVPKEWPIEEYKDQNTQNYWNQLKAEGADEKRLANAMANIQKLARDNSRTPMQWSGSAHAGFTTPEAEPWMRVNDDYSKYNVASQQNDPNSVLSFYRLVLALRKKYIDLFAAGTFSLVDEENHKTVVFVKRFHDQAALVVCNFTSSSVAYSVPEEFHSIEPLLSNVDTSSPGALAPYEARVHVKG
ncbi:glycoside hydrolase family 13 protein [Xylona heveae TC161]|uniref:Glycoside hydrolase family 13 protein n=1 Tax=Xylona heveae (strain CBS 132557 / TC161) TaxID=1328760 RepID=A0A165H6T9_XYLHT|nr:glycoside hydrolase family 13 protein [Xylona heveae TC161]KZF23065.1 glycoside hydrolase family 13 protein [Xylona heveae TC161]